MAGSAGARRFAQAPECQPHGATPARLCVTRPDAINPCSQTFFQRQTSPLFSHCSLLINSSNSLITHKQVMFGAVQLQLRHLVYYHPLACLCRVLLSCNQITGIPTGSKTSTSKQANWLLSKPDVLTGKHCCTFSFWTQKSCVREAEAHTKAAGTK